MLTLSFVLALGVVGMSGCVVVDDDGGSGRTHVTASPVAGGSKGQRTVGARAPEAPGGEIWQWALGRNAWKDPYLAHLSSKLGKTTNTNISDYADGFGLTLDRTGVVVAVLLMNDETRLGISASDTTYNAYLGMLPAGLSWTDTYDTVVARYGAGQQTTGGWGVEYTYAYQADTGQRIDVTYVAKHQDALPGSPLHVIAVSSMSG